MKHIILIQLFYFTFETESIRRTDDKCCDVINIKGLSKDNYYAKGNYVRQPIAYNGRPFYKQQNGKFYIYYHSSGNWQVYLKRRGPHTKVSIQNSSHQKCPPLSGWVENYFLESVGIWSTINLVDAEITCGRSYFNKNSASNDCTAGYDYQYIHGFGVCAEKNVFNFYGELRTKLANDLRHISDVLPKNALNILSDLRIYVNSVYKYSGTICTWNSASWLEKYDNDPKKARNIEIKTAQKYIDYLPNGRSYYNVLLHEVAHAYHFRTWVGTSTAIKLAYDAAMQKGLYNYVKKYDNTSTSAYATKSETEYFAEMTVAYFSQRRARVSYQGRYFPFYRNQLKSYDRNGYELCKKVWNFNVYSVQNQIETNLTHCHNQCKKKCKTNDDKDSCKKTCIIKCNSS